MNEENNKPVIAEAEWTSVIYAPICGVCSKEVWHCDYCKSDYSFEVGPDYMSRDNIICVHISDDYEGKREKTRHFCSEKCMRNYFKEHPELKWSIEKVKD